LHPDTYQAPLRFLTLKNRPVNTMIIIFFPSLIIETAQQALPPSCPKPHLFTLVPLRYRTSAKAPIVDIHIPASNFLANRRVFFPSPALVHCTTRCRISPVFKFSVLGKAPGSKLDERRRWFLVLFPFTPLVPSDPLPPSFFLTLQGFRGPWDAFSFLILK